MAKKGKKLSKPQPLAKAARPKSISGAVNSEEAPLLPHERVVSAPNPSNRPHATLMASQATDPSLRRANSAPSCLESTPSASAAVFETTQGTLVRSASKKLQKKQRLDDDKGDGDDVFAAVPAATLAMIQDAQLALGLGPREPIEVDDDYYASSPPSLHLGAAAALPTTTDVDDEDDNDDDEWQPPPVFDVQHPVNVLYLNTNKVVGRGALMTQLKRWMCCKCGRRTHYESPICSCLDCCHNRCEDYCTALEPA